MDVTPLVREGHQIIQGYAADGFKVSGVSYSGAVLVKPSKVLQWSAETLDSLTLENFQLIIEMKDDLDVILLGTGKSFQLLPPTLKQSLAELSISVDVMDTGAACRTYNVLMAEGRRVIAALLPDQ